MIETREGTILFLDENLNEVCCARAAFSVTGGAQMGIRLTNASDIKVTAPGVTIVAISVIIDHGPASTCLLPNAIMPNDTLTILIESESLQASAL